MGKPILFYNLWYIAKRQKKILGDSGRPAV